MDKEYQTHLFTYRHDGAEWILPIKASSQEDAKARIGRLAWATYDGVAVAKVEIPTNMISQLWRKLRRLALKTLDHLHA